MKALILAAGYATRLRPLTDTTAKPLLPVGGRPMVDWILDKIREAGADEVHLVTNTRFAPAFERWAEANGVRVHDDGTSSNDDRLGAIGDVRFVVERAGIDDDLLVIAGDNLFDFSLAEVAEWWRGKDGSAIVVHEVEDRELLKHYSVVTLDPDDRLTGFVEKPPEPESTLAGTATYIFARSHLPLVARYLDDGNTPDQPGNFIAWLQAREPVYGFRSRGEWLDIGTPAQLLEADNRLRTRAGLPRRDTYSTQT